MLQFKREVILFFESAQGDRAIFSILIKKHEEIAFLRVKSSINSPFEKI